MKSAFALAVRLLVRAVLTFCLIVAVLLAGHWALKEWRALAAVAQDVLTLERGDAQIGADGARLRSETLERVQRLRAAPADLIDRRIADIAEQLLALAAQPEPGVLSFPLPSGAGMAQSLVSKSRRMVQMELLTQERDFLVGLRAAARAALDRSAAGKELAALHAAHVAAYQPLSTNLRAQSQLRMNNFFMSRVPGTDAYRERDKLEQEAVPLLARNNAAGQAYLAQQKAISLIAAPVANLQFIVNDARVNAAMARLRGSIADGKAFAARNLAAKFLDAVREVAPIAGWVMLSLIVTPVIIKVVFYYVLAPLAERLPPFIVDRSASGLLEIHDSGGKRASAMGNSSAPSAVVTIAQGHELLIHSGCIQSSSVSVKAETRWLLDWANPFTCLAAGLFALTRIVTTQPASIVVSPAEDPLSEIAVITLPEGSSMVFQPRALVGVIHRSGQAVHMARHWRLGSLHAWLTLQLRYLVFRGPLTLIVKGCRGVRVDAVDHGRVISQSATLGFSTSTAYSTSRCQTFLPYLLGRCPLLNDRFKGDVGFCIYEEALPADSQKGIVGRGLEGLTDSILKVLGI